MAIDATTISDFLKDVNARLAPVLVLTLDDRDDDTIFRVGLPNTIYAETDNVVTTTAFSQLIIDLSKKHFQRMPSFNNTHVSFWYD